MSLPTEPNWGLFAIVLEILQNDRMYAVQENGVDRGGGVVPLYESDHRY